MCHPPSESWSRACRRGRPGAGASPGTAPCWVKAPATGTLTAGREAEHYGCLSRLPEWRWGRERDSAPTSSLICEGLTLTRERDGSDFSLVSANKEELGCLKLAKTNQILDQGERPQTPAVLTKWPEQGLCRNGLCTLHTRRHRWCPRPLHTPALLHSGEEGEQGHQVPSSWPSPPQPPWNRESAGRAHRHSPGAGGPEQAAAHAPGGTLIRREMFVPL